MGGVVFIVEHPQLQIKSNMIKAELLMDETVI